jgi:hypothetical protein
LYYGDQIPEVTVTAPKRVSGYAETAYNQFMDRFSDVANQALTWNGEYPTTTTNTTKVAKPTSKAASTAPISKPVTGGAYVMQSVDTNTPTATAKPATPSTPATKTTTTTSTSSSMPASMTPAEIERYNTMVKFASNLNNMKVAPTKPNAISISAPTIDTSDLKNRPTSDSTPTVGDNKYSKAADIINSLGATAGMIGNLFAKPEYESVVRNPYTGAINRSMAKRRLNIEPVKAANRRARAMANYNMANMNSNTGSNLAARTQAAISNYAQNADLYASVDNARNQYLADAANMMNNLGQQAVQSQTYTNDLNARNRATARNFGTKNLENLNKYSQMQQLMRNSYARDMMVMPALQRMIQSYYPTEDYIKMFSSYGS